MTPKEKPKPQIKTRASGRISTGMFDRVKLRHPIEEIIEPGAAPQTEESTLAQGTIVQPAIAPHAIEQGAIAQETPQPSHDATAAPSAIAQYAIVPGQYTSVPNGIFDRVIPSLHVYDQTVLLRLFRLSRGYHSDTCKVGYGTLAKACNISIRQAQISIGRLILAGLIERLEVEGGGSVKKERGSVYRVILPAATIARPATLAQPAIARPATSKENVLKETNKQEVAAHCEKCKGTGFYYPKGLEGGVAKCDHK